MTMIDEIEPFPTKTFDMATAMQWTREGSTSNAPLLETYRILSY